LEYTVFDTSNPELELFVLMKQNNSHSIPIYNILEIYGEKKKL